MISEGPEMGMSGSIITYDPHDPLYHEKYEFAKRTIANLPCFMYHRLLQCGYCQSTHSRLMRFFYIEKAQLAPQSLWDPDTITVMSHFVSQISTYIEDNARYDSYLHKRLNHTPPHKQLLDMTDTICKGLLDSLGYTPDEKGYDVGSKISGVSNGMLIHGVTLPSTQRLQQIGSFILVNVPNNLPNLVNGMQQAAQKMNSKPRCNK
jgi:hypothetical protein